MVNTHYKINQLNRKQNTNRTCSDFAVLLCVTYTQFVLDTTRMGRQQNTDPTDSYVAIALRVQCGSTQSIPVRLEVLAYANLM